VCTKFAYIYRFLHALGIVVKAIDFGTVAVHQNLPTVSVLLVRLQPDTKEEHHAPVPATIQDDVDSSSNSERGPSKNGGRGTKKTSSFPCGGRGTKKSISTCSWWLLNDLQLTNCSPKKSLGPISRRLKTWISGLSLPLPPPLGPAHRCTFHISRRM
jgi:hypothetical protein